MSGDITLAASRENSIRNLRAAIPMISESGVTVGLENVWNGFFLSPYDMLSFLDELDSEILQCDSEFTEDKEKGVCLLRANAVIKYDIAKEVPYEIDYYNISERLPKPKE
jgi:hypothetical protein